MKILIVEDSQDLAINIGDFLSARHVVDFANDGLAGIRLALENDFDIIVLDINLPGLDGLELCRKFRADSKRNIPILMLSARDTLENKLEGYSVGCDDYLAKPFSLVELEARLVALHRLYSRSQDEDVLKVADLEYQSGTRTLSRAGRKLSLKPTAMRILVELMRASHRVVGRAELEHKIWKESPPDSDALRAHIYAIRSSIDKDAKDKLLHTIHGVGYRLVSQDEL